MTHDEDPDDPVVKDRREHAVLQAELKNLRTRAPFPENVRPLESFDRSAKVVVPPSGKHGDAPRP